MSDLLSSLSAEEKKKIRKTSQPEWTAPMLATLSDDHFSKSDWIFERKFDGERCLVFRDSKEVKIMSRNKKKINNTYPELVEPLLSQPVDHYIADGEIVTFEGDTTSFGRLQERINIEHPDNSLIRRVAVYLYFFDLLYLDKFDLTGLSLRARKRLLKNQFDFNNKIRYAIHRNEEGKKFLEEACRKNWEGLIAKKVDSSYEHKRSRAWLKFKCVKRQEFVIGGYTDPEGERKGFGALLIGFYDDNKLMYAGKVGTGYDNELLVNLHKKMERKTRKTNPFTSEVKEKNVHWITPELVAEVGFTEWTSAHKLRHPRFIGLRKDKNPKKVVREEPK